MKNYSILAIIISFNLVVQSQTSIPGGMVNGNWDLDGSPYLIQSSISIDYGQTLTIEAGCEIIFQPGVEFLVNGTLEAMGSLGDSIVFTSSSGNWSGLQIVGLWEYNHSVFEYCLIENATTALLTFYTGSVSITHTGIRNNNLGVHIQHSSAYLSDIDVYSNTDVGIKMDDNCCTQEFILTDFKVRNNGGRGIELNFDSGGLQEIENGMIINNSGGGIYSSSTDGFAKFSNLNINVNGPADFGGGIHAFASCLIENCNISNNVADFGGGIYLRTNLDIQDINTSKISNNEALIDGGGIYITDGATNVFNCEITSNVAGSNGGGVYVEKVNFIHGIKIRNLLVSGNESANLGGAFYLEFVDGDLDIYQSTITNNNAGVSGGAFTFLDNSFNETVEVNSCIIRANTPNEINNPVGGFELNYSNCEGGWPGPGINSIDADPQFILSGLYSFDLQEGSPCINAGDPSIVAPNDETDLAGRSRIHNDTIDIGAFETNQVFGPTWGLELGVWLQGAFSDGKMTNQLQINDLLPNLQPFAPSPWNYTGNDSLSDAMELAITDWILLELYDASSLDEYCACSRFYRKALPLTSNGNIVDLKGKNIIKFVHDIDDSLFVVLRHRNHLDVISAYPPNDTMSIFHFDFRSSSAQAYGGSQSLQEIASGEWAMISGDINQNDSVSASDREAWAALAGKAFYHPADLDFNGQINNLDKNEFLQFNYEKWSKVPASDTVFNCGEFFIDARNGKCYPTELIGEQCWMAKNLDIGVRIDSLDVPTQNDTIEKYCYADLDENCENFGALYSWDEMMAYGNLEGTQGICPEGWHIPSDDEWKTLEGNTDTQFGTGDPEWNIEGWRGFDAGLNLKSESGWMQSGNGNDQFGYEAIPAGYREFSSGYFRLHEGGYFWSSTELDPNYAWRRGFHFSKDGVHRWAYEKAAARSLRCVRD